MALSATREAMEALGIGDIIALLSEWHEEGYQSIEGWVHQYHDMMVSGHSATQMTHSIRYSQWEDTNTPVRSTRGEVIKEAIRSHPPLQKVADSHPPIVSLHGVSITPLDFPSGLGIDPVLSPEVRNELTMDEGGLGTHGDMADESHHGGDDDDEDNGDGEGRGSGHQGGGGHPVPFFGNFVQMDDDEEDEEHDEDEDDDEENDEDMDMDLDEDDMDEGMGGLMGQFPWGMAGGPIPTVQMPQMNPTNAFNAQLTNLFTNLNPDMMAGLLQAFDGMNAPLEMVLNQLSGGPVPRPTQRPRPSPTSRTLTLKGMALPQVFNAMVYEYIITQGIYLIGQLNVTNVPGASEVCQQLVASITTYIQKQDMQHSRLSAFRAFLHRLVQSYRVDIMGRQIFVCRPPSIPGEHPGVLAVQDPISISSYVYNK